MRCRHRLFLVAFALVSTALPAALRADDFANARLSAGMDAYRTRRYAEASDQLRIACFGLLDQPAALTECLVWLAIAQDLAGRKAAVGATVERFLEVERRFSAYGKAHLDASVRTAFQALLGAHASPETLASVPSLSPPPKTGGAANSRKEP